MKKFDIDQIRSSQVKLTDWQSEEHNFIPLSGCKDPNFHGNVVLDEEVNHFLSADEQKVLLLAGHSGAGKSLYTQGLITRLWSHYQEDLPVPVWIA